MPLPEQKFGCNETLSSVGEVRRLLCMQASGHEERQSKGSGRYSFCHSSVQATVFLGKEPVRRNHQERDALQTDGTGGIVLLLATQVEYRERGIAESG